MTKEQQAYIKGMKEAAAALEVIERAYFLTEGDSYTQKVRKEHIIAGLRAAKAELDELVSAKAKALETAKKADKKAKE